MSKTLADMTPQEQQACVGMWSDLHIPAVVLATGEQRRAAKKALGATDV